MSQRSFIRITGDDRVSFPQGIVTNDVTKLHDEKIQFAALLSPQGKILHDMFLIAADNAIVIDTQTLYKDTLMKRLMMYKLRAEVDIRDQGSEVGDQKPVLPDPRLPELPKRDYATPSSLIADPRYPIPALGRDFEPDSVVALDAGYDLLHAISFTKGCYVGQEVTARMHYKNIARRGFYILTNDTAPTRLALLRFDEVEAAQHRITIDNITYHAALPGWMQPKLAQFKSSHHQQ